MNTIKRSLVIFFLLVSMLFVVQCSIVMASERVLNVNDFYIKLAVGDVGILDFSNSIELNAYEYGDVTINGVKQVYINLETTPSKQVKIKALADGKACIRVFATVRSSSNRLRDVEYVYVITTGNASENDNTFLTRKEEEVLKSSVTRTLQLADTSSIKLKDGEHIELAVNNPYRAYTENRRIAKLQVKSYSGKVGIGGISVGTTNITVDEYEDNNGVLGKKINSKKIQVTVEPAGNLSTSSTSVGSGTKIIVSKDKTGNNQTVKVNENTESTGNKTSSVKIIDIKQATVSINPLINDYTGEEIKPNVSLVYDDKMLVEGTDYILNYKDNINMGNAIVNIIGKGNFSGNLEKHFVIIQNKNNEFDNLEQNQEQESQKEDLKDKEVNVEKNDNVQEGLPFWDVKKEDWFYDDVKYVYENNIFNGLSNIKFGPDGGMTRGMLVTVLYRLEGVSETATSSYVDVPRDSYYSVPIEWASKNGIVNGVGNNQFAPDNVLTRQDLATIIARYINKKYIALMDKSISTNQLVDANETSEYAKSSVNYMIQKGLIDIEDGKYFRPKEKATRAVVAKVMRILSENK